MRIIRPFSLIAIFAALAFGPGASFAQDQSQSGSGDSVAEAARKAREQKKNAPKPKLSLTDDDLAGRTSNQSAVSTVGTAPAAAKPAAAAQPSGTSAAQSADKAEKREDPNSEAAWRKRFAAVRRQLADAETELDVLNREAQKADLQYYSDPQKALQEQYSRDEINQKNAKIAEKKQQIADLKRRLGDMEDELRHAGGDPSWAR